MSAQPKTRRRFHAVAPALAFACAGVEPCFAASSGFVDTAATVLAVFIIIAVPIVGIALFWLVHVLPEKIAEKRQHPQKEAIHVLCLLSLVFGGLLWPLAWLWAYTKPVLHKMAYGRDKHDDYYEETRAEGDGSPRAQSLREELDRLRHDLEALEKRGGSSDALRGIRERLGRLESRTTSDIASRGGG
jgi:CBS domain containing-hemolysin-like protein